MELIGFLKLMAMIFLALLAFRLIQAKVNLPQSAQKALAFVLH